MIVVLARSGFVVFDKRKRERAVKVEGPRWPLAWELARFGTPIGVVLVPVGDGLCCAVTVGVAGELIELRRLPSHFLVRWCLNRHLRLHHTLAELVQAQLAGRELGWMPGRVVEVKAGRSWLVAGVPFVCTLPGEPVRPGVLELPAEVVF